MAEYIEREALLAAYDRLHEGPPGGARKLIEEAPAADVAPVRHARWDDSGRFTFPGGSTAVRCSGCGCALTVSEYLLNKWNYCPVCGAQMNGGTENA